MGVFDDLKNAADNHEEQIEQGIDKVGDMIDEKTDGKFASQVDQAQDFLKDHVGKQDG